MAEVIAGVKLKHELETKPIVTHLYPIRTNDSVTELCGYAAAGIQDTLYVFIKRGYSAGA
jgi:hypothetical protein